MPDPTPAPVAPAAAVPPAAPAPAAPEPAVVAPAPVEAKKPSLLSNILDLVSPEDSKVEEPKKPEPAPEVKKEEPKPEPAKPAEPAPEKKVSVKQKPKLPLPDIKGEVKSAVEEALKPITEKKPDAAPPVEAKPVVDDSDLTPEEREEIELAEFAESKDPSKKGLADSLRKFHAEHKKFLEGKIAAEGDDYDPKSDPEYKRFLAKNEPKFSASERKAIFREKVAAEAEERALRAAESKLKPEVEALQRQLREVKVGPAIKQRVNQLMKEIAEGADEEITTFYKANGEDPKKVEEMFPEESKIIRSTIMGATTLASEFLAIRNGIKTFNGSDPKHSFLDEFVRDQANKFIATNDSSLLVRDGKTFVHPDKWDPKMANTHWTFDEEDVLLGLSISAKREAKALVEQERKRIQAAATAMEKRRTAQSGAAAPAPAAPQPVESPTTPGNLAPGAATSTPTKTSSALSGLLNL